MLFHSMKIVFEFKTRQFYQSHFHMNNLVGTKWKDSTDSTESDTRFNHVPRLVLLLNSPFPQFPLENSLSSTLFIDRVVTAR